MDFFETGHEQVNADRDPDLRFDGVFGGAEERLDTQVLLDPLEEQFDVPAAFVERGDGLGREAEMIGEKDQMLARFGIAQAHSPQFVGIEFFAASALETDDLVAPQAAGSVDRTGLHDIGKRPRICPPKAVAIV